MQRRRQILSSTLLLALASCAAPGHRVLTQGNGRLAIVGADGAIEWEMPWGGIHDIHALPSGNVMVQQGAASVVEIDRALHREEHRTSTGTRWPSKNDGRVVVRLLLNHGVTPRAGDAKVARYIAEYAAKIGAHVSLHRPSA